MRACPNQVHRATLLCPSPGAMQTACQNATGDLGCAECSGSSCTACYRAWNKQPDAAGGVRRGSCMKCSVGREGNGVTPPSGRAAPCCPCRSATLTFSLRSPAFHCCWTGLTNAVDECCTAIPAITRFRLPSRWDRSL